jgi:hypothetical protein
MDDLQFLYNNLNEFDITFVESLFISYSFENYTLTNLNLKNEISIICLTYVTIFEW